MHNKILNNYENYIVYNNEIIGIFYTSLNSIVKIPLLVIKQNYYSKFIIILSEIEEYFSKDNDYLSFYINSENKSILYELLKIGYKSIGYSFRMLSYSSKIHKFDEKIIFWHWGT